MDFEAKIQWKPGMPLTASVLRHRDEDLDERYRALLNTALGIGRSGILPHYEYHAWGAFSGRTYELNELTFTALLPSGNIFHICEDLKIDIPSLEDGAYYLAVGKTGNMHEFECDDVPYSRPEYELIITTGSDIIGKDLFPMKKFLVNDGILTVDENYIPPVMILSQNGDFKKYIDRFVDDLMIICSNPKMEHVYGHFLLLHYCSRLKAFNLTRPVYEFIEFISEIATTLDYAISDGLVNRVDSMPEELTALKTDARRAPVFIDIQTFLEWFGEYLKVLPSMLERLVIEDDQINLEQLKREIKDELFEQLRSQLTEQLYAELHDKVVGEVCETVSDSVRILITDKLHPELKDVLTEELRGVLYPLLYNSLYDELSKLSYRPAEQEEDVFNPII